MKNKIAAIISLLALMALLPAAVVNISGKSAENSVATNDSAESSDDKSIKICSYAEKLSNNNFCDEALKAAVIIANTNYLSGNFEKTGNFNSNAELFNKIHKIYNSNKENYLSHNNKAVFIPSSVCSNGNTISSEKYPYLRPAASPWDSECGEFSEDSECTGVSMYGINYLCQKGYTAENALKYYLPLLEVKKT